MWVTCCTVDFHQCLLILPVIEHVKRGLNLNLPMPGQPNKDLGHFLSREIAMPSKKEINPILTAGQLRVRPAPGLFPALKVVVVDHAPLLHVFHVERVSVDRIFGFQGGKYEIALDGDVATRAVHIGGV